MTRGKLNDVLFKSYSHGFAVQSNYARRYAQEVGALASMGLITTKVVRGTNPVFGRMWRITLDGMKFLSEEGIV
jgi:hypothetical protein